MNEHLAKPTVKLLQRLTVTGAELEHHYDTKEWFYNSPGNPSERLINSQERAAKDLLTLCLLQTTLKRPPIFNFKITSEANKCLTDHKYRPVMLRH